MDGKKVKELFQSVEKVKVLIIGDVMIDAYTYGEVERISPEAPVPILNIKNKENRLGGAANVALNVKALGATPLLCSVIGNDFVGNELFALLDQNGIDSHYIIKDNDRKTTSKNRIISRGHHLTRLDEEIDYPLEERLEQQYIDLLLSLLDSCDVVLFEDYDKGCISPRLISTIVEAANQKNIPTVVDPKKRNFMHYHHVTLFKPNLKELKEGLGIAINPKDLSQVRDAVALLESKIHFNNALITLSEMGVFYYNAKDEGNIPAHIRKISDVSGAGDTVISVVACFFPLQVPLSWIAKISNLAGGIVCEYPGVVPINKTQLFQECMEDH